MQFISSIRFIVMYNAIVTSDKTSMPKTLCFCALTSKFLTYTHNLLSLLMNFEACIMHEYVCHDNVCCHTHKFYNTTLTSVEVVMFVPHTHNSNNNGKLNYCRCCINSSAAYIDWYLHKCFRCVLYSNKNHPHIICYDTLIYYDSILLDLSIFCLFHYCEISEIIIHIWYIMYSY